LDAQRRQIGGPQHDVTRLLQQGATPAEHLPEVQSVEPVAATPLGGKFTRWLAFRTRRSNGGGRRGPCVPTGFRITFAEPVRGPLALGYGAHFGLGAFVPESTPFR
jgi:CRISPR-associated protein Csb2